MTTTPHTPDLDDMICHASRIADLIEAATDLFDQLPNSEMQAKPYQQRHLGALLYTLKESTDALVAGLERVDVTERSS